MTEIAHTCSTCRYWLMGQRHRHEIGLGLAICGRVTDFLFATKPILLAEDAQRAIRLEYANHLAFVRSGYDVGHLLTKGEFGCVQWTAQILTEYPTQHD